MEEASASSSATATAKQAQTTSIFGGGDKVLENPSSVAQPDPPPKSVAVEPTSDGGLTTGSNDTSPGIIDSEKESPPPQEEPPMTPTVFETFEKHYDLTLLVGTSPTAEFKVCSRTVARKLEFFDKMLYGQFVEKKPEFGDWVVKLPETDQASFRIILTVIFHDEPKIPDKLGEELYSLITTIDYFNAYHMFKRQQDSWRLLIRGEFSATNLSARLSDRLFWAAWNLGCKGEINSVLRRVVQTVQRNKEGRYCFNDGTLLQFSPELARFNLEDKIARCHPEFITSMSEGYEKEYAIMLDFKRPEDKVLCRSKETRGGQSRDICDRALLGSLVRELGKRGSSDARCFNPKYLMNLSVEQCAERLLSFKIKGVEASWRDHQGCNPSEKLHNIVHTIRAQANSITILTDEDIAYLDHQRKRWGR